MSTDILYREIEIRACLTLRSPTSGIGKIKVIDVFGRDAIEWV